jgi:hypothetical protein
MTWAMPKRWFNRYTQDSALRAFCVASWTSGGFRQMTQFPQSLSSRSPK